MALVDRDGKVHQLLELPSGEGGEVVYPAVLGERDLRALVDVLQEVIDVLRGQLEAGAYPRD